VGRFGFHIISHYHGESWQMPDLGTLCGQVWISHHHPPSWGKYAGAKSQDPKLLNLAFASLAIVMAKVGGH